MEVVLPFPIWLSRTASRVAATVRMAVLSFFLHRPRRTRLILLIRSILHRIPRTSIPTIRIRTTRTMWSPRVTRTRPSTAWRVRTARPAILARLVRLVQPVSLDTAVARVVTAMAVPSTSTPTLLRPFYIVRLLIVRLLVETVASAGKARMARMVRMVRMVRTVRTAKSARMVSMTASRVRAAPAV
jgi:hypothetical protein